MAADPQIATVTDLLRRSQSTLSGKYRGVVADNKDPEKRGRLKLKVASVFGAAMTTDWVIGAFPFGGNSAEAAMFIPKIGSHVLVEFIEGDRSSPIWTACYFPADAAADNGRPPEAFDLEQGGLHLLRTETGVELRLEDNRKGESDGGEQRFVVRHPRGAEIVIDPKGVITIVDREGATLLLDPENKIVRLTGHGAGAIEMLDDKLTIKHGDSVSIVLDSSGIVLNGGALKLDGDSVGLGKGAASPVMNAQAFEAIFASHVHPCPTGSTTPPAPPLPTFVQTVGFAKVKGA